MGIAYIPLPNGSAAHAGGYASGTIELGERPAMILPSSAVISRDGRSYVFEVDTVHQTVIQHEVTTGRIRGDQVEISSGLKPNTPVVRSGGGFLNDGDTVHTVKGAA
jgi:multidrug efflux pump subunit AcrA (membrane-fusion protein)